MKPGFNIREMKQGFLHAKNNVHKFYSERLSGKLSLSLFGFKRVHDCV